MQVPLYSQLLVVDSREWTINQVWHWIVCTGVGTNNHYETRQLTWVTVIISSLYNDNWTSRSLC